MLVLILIIVALIFELIRTVKHNQTGINSINHKIEYDKIKMCSIFGILAGKMLSQ